jgi:hypothetical protein
MVLMTKVSPETNTALDAAIKKTGRSKRDIVETALQEYLARINK